MSPLQSGCPSQSGPPASPASSSPPSRLLKNARSVELLGVPPTHPAPSYFTAFANAVPLTGDRLPLSPSHAGHLPIPWLRSHLGPPSRTVSASLLQSPHLLLLPSQALTHSPTPPHQIAPSSSISPTRLHTQGRGSVATLAPSAPALALNEGCGLPEALAGGPVLASGSPTEPAVIMSLSNRELAGG